MSTATNTKVVTFPREPKSHAVMVRVPESVAVRLDAVSGRTGIPRASIIRTALIERLNQLEAQSTPVAPIIAAQLREAGRLGLNVERVLADAISKQARAAACVIDPFPHRD
ncbi:MAG: hypothetical protein RJA36_3842 [Pseudomonadota bacterium]|jgi:predicted DNA-binding protein